MHSMLASLWCLWDVVQTMKWSSRIGTYRNRLATNGTKSNTATVVRACGVIKRVDACVSCQQWLLLYKSCPVSEVNAGSMVWLPRRYDQWPVLLMLSCCNAQDILYLPNDFMFASPWSLMTSIVDLDRLPLFADNGIRNAFVKWQILHNP